jgi:uncharacterized protein (TIGR03083 family)
MGDHATPLEPTCPVDARPLFRPVGADLVTLLRALPAGAWNHPTVAGRWLVRDVVAHLLDTALRRLSWHRDGMVPPAAVIASERDLVEFVNHLNAEWVESARRLSARVLTDLYERASADAAGWFESLPLDAPALFPVSWAGEQESAGWFDIGREFTELWHHQEQIRMATGADSLADSRYLAVVIDVAVRGLPHAFRNVAAEAGETVAIDITGAAGGRWTLSRAEHGWSLFRGTPASATTRVALDPQAAWKLLFNALPENEAATAMHVEGRADLARALVHARSVIV